MARPALTTTACSGWLAVTAPCWHRASSVRRAEAVKKTNNLASQRAGKGRPEVRNMPLEGGGEDNGVAVARGGPLDASLSLSLSLLSGTTAPCFLENCETLQFWFASFVFCNDSTSKMWQTKMKIESGIVGKQDK